MHIEERTLQLLKQALPLLDRVSGDRIRHELNVILQEETDAGHAGPLTAANCAVLSAIHLGLTCR